MKSTDVKKIGLYLSVLVKVAGMITENNQKSNDQPYSEDDILIQKQTN